jgi:hypothetical protein
MMRLALTAGMLLWSIATAIAQEPPSSQPREQQTCVFAGESYSEGAEFCVTSHAGLQCENGKWSRDSQLDCSGEVGNERPMPHEGGGDDHTMSNHTMPDHMTPDHMMPHQ